MKNILLVQGANMEMLGQREPHLYGKTTAAELDDIIRETAQQRDFTVEIFYTNVEGHAIDRIFAADRGDTDGLIMNPAGFSHAGYALRDAIKAITIPYVEVHMTNVERRGIHSVIASTADGVVFGMGVGSYLVGIDAMLRLLDSR